VVGRVGSRIQRSALAARTSRTTPDSSTAPTREAGRHRHGDTRRPYEPEIFDSVDAFYRRFYFRAGKIAEMFRSPQAAARRLREGREFIQFLGRRTQVS
jgi:hypothetical protein